MLDFNMQKYDNYITESKAISSESNNKKKRKKLKEL